MLTKKQRMAKWIKSHRKRTTKHIAITTVVVLLFVILSAYKHDPIPVVNADNRSLVTVTLVGDIMLGRNVQLITNKYGYNHIFKYIKPYFTQSDIVTGNLESPILKNKRYVEANKDILLSAPTAAAMALKKAGFSIINLANNHIKDYGKRGIADTINSLRRAELDIVGSGENIQSAGRVCYKEINGFKIGFIGLSDILPKHFSAHKHRSGVLPSNPKVFFPLVAMAKRKADIIIVHMHWGREYDNNAHPRQKDLGHALIEAGADIVVGHHPHVLEPIEVYKNGIIFYSLGNFVFDQGWSRTKESILAQVKWMKNGEKRIECHPIFIQSAQPKPLLGWTNLYRREKIYAQLGDKMIYTKSWNQTWQREGDKLVRIIKREPKI